MRHRRLVLLTSIIVAGVLLTPSLPAVAASGHVVDIPIGALTASDPAADVPDFIGNDTSQIIVEATQKTASPVTCSYRFDFAAEVLGTYSADEWNSGQVELNVGPTELHSYWFGTSYEVDCFPEVGDWYLSWRLEPVASTGPSVTLRENDSQTTRFTRYQAAPTQTVLYSGDTVRIVGAPGAWPVATGASRTASEVAIFAGDPLFESAVVIYDFEVTPDGSTLSFVVPDQQALDDLNLELPNDLSVTLFADHGAAGADLVRWNGQLTISPRVSSTTKTSLSPALGFSFVRTKASVVVSAPGAAAPTGVLTFSVDGKKVGTVQLASAAKGHASFRLPYLPRGRHLITVAYSGSPTVAPSVSPPTALRILF